MKNERNTPSLIVCVEFIPTRHIPSVYEINRITISNIAIVDLFLEIF